MDSERTIFAVAVGLAFAVGCYVLWGPGALRPKRRKGHVIGLVNLGHTCFLNTLLQALASCPTVLEWLLQQDVDDTSLISSLRTVLLALNGEASDVVDPHTPSEVIAALRKHHWVISPGEQDAHELFHVLLETLDEEATSLSSKNGSLSDILVAECNGQGDDIPNTSTISKLSGNDLQISCDKVSNSVVSQTTCVPFSRSVKFKGNAVVTTTPLPASLPFRGTLTSQLKCTVCGFKSSLRFDKFDTLSLPLSAPFSPGKATLKMLLDDFVKTEIVKEVTCDNCSRGPKAEVRTTASKSVSFGKLPKCLCLHISRTTWNQDGLSQKREDYVDFPEFLEMDSYTHRQSILKEKQKSKDLQNLSIDIGKHPNGNLILPKTHQTSINSRSRHLYRLKAVVVHYGDIHSGHFVTYRKGPIKSRFRHRPLSLESKIGGSKGLVESKRWFFTSDSVIREATLCQALLSNAYMLFYEKCMSYQ